MHFAEATTLHCKVWWLCWPVSKASQQKEAWSAPKYLDKWVQWRWFSKKQQWTNISRWHCTSNNHRLWKHNTGCQATWVMSFSTLPPDSRTLVSKWNTKLAIIWKEDFAPLRRLSPGKMPPTTTLAKFLDTSVRGGSWCLDPSLSPFLVKFTQILELILLDNPHKAAVLSVRCASFSSTLLPST